MHKEKQQVIQTFNRAASTYDQACHIQYDTGKQLIKLARCYLDHPQNLLDIGCGTGLITAELKQHFPHTNLAALDLAEKLLAQARTRPILSDVTFLQNDLEALPFANESYTSLFSNMALQWSFTPQAALQEWARVLKPQGYLLVSLPVAGTFQELVNARQQLGQPINPINTQDPLTFCQYIAQSDLKLVSLNITHQTHYYPSIVPLIRAIKQTGANYIPGRYRSAMTGRHYLQHLQAVYPKVHNTLPLSYRIALFIAQRS